jgi:hypothetical protein
MTRAELKSKHIAELHALAAEADLPGYRGMRREQLIEALLSDQGGEEGAEAPPRLRRRRGRRGRGASRRSEAEAAEPEEAGSSAEAPPEEHGEEVMGVIDIVAQGHGFIRLDGLDPGRVTSTSPHPRSGAASSAPATRSAGPPASRGAGSAIAP